MDWVSEVKRRQAAKGGYLPAGMKPSGTLSTYKPTLRERGTDFLRKMLFSDDRAGQQRAERLSDVAETVTPYGLATGAYDAGRAGGQGDYATAGLMTAMAGLPGPNPKGFKAYHGSPHDFDRFSLDKIGTGEGAQAYGHGLYFAETEGTARFYRDQLSTPPRDIKAMAEPYAVLPDADALRKLGHAIKSAELNGRMSEAKDYKKVADWIQAGRPDEFSAGKMYEVQINADPDSFLDWDKPLSEQPESVRNTLVDEYIKDAPWIAEQGLSPSTPGESLYGLLGQKNPADNTERLKKAGIPGIKYLDQGSRGRAGNLIKMADGRYFVDAPGNSVANGKGIFNSLSEAEAYKKSLGSDTRNYVVFDDKLIEILKKYGLFGPVVGAGAMAAQDDSAPY